jgi:3-methyladenine DNA glycosylase/8-oxoguanine DNA glycosylase
MPSRRIRVEGPFDLVGTLRPLARGSHDPTIRLGPGVAWLALRTTAGAVTVHLRHDGDDVVADTWGPGADATLERVPALLGIGPGFASTADLRDAPHPVVADLARRRPGLRIPATGALLDALIPAILEQKVTGTEARRAWCGLIRAHGEPAPVADGPVATPAATMRLRPDATTLARLPAYAYHPFGVEGRRATTIRRVASRADWLQAAVALPLPEARARLGSIPGIGPWTVAEVAVRALGDPDAVSIGDFHLPNLVAWALAREPRADDERMLRLLAPFEGRRALVVRLLEASGIRAPRYGPRLAPRRIDDL